MLACILAAIFAGWLAPARPAAAQEAPVEQRVLVQFAPGTPGEVREARIAQMRGELIQWMPQINVAEVRAPGDLLWVASEMAGPDITFLEPDLPVGAAYLPTDPDFADPARSYGFDHIQAQAAWELTTGSAEVLIAVVDSGIALTHPEFAGRLVQGYDFVNEDDFPEDETGHGTHVAGIIAAGMDNGQGVAGVCAGCRLLPVKVLNSANQGAWSDLAQGILYAADNGARIINLSLGSPTPSQTLEAAIRYAQQRGALIIAAAGNYGATMPFYPAALDGVVAVGATTMQESRWIKSNYGAYLDLVAPGDLIYSTYHLSDNTYGGYTYLSGTSMATPFASGLAGLLLSLHPTLTAAELRAALAAGADDLGAPGWDPEYGHGRLNAYRSLTTPLELLAIADEGETAAGAKRLYLPTVRSR
ncbi:MAG TPA: S8 family serine peptidase [Caldilineaceae bacterium]|nr:S8 family serine peptidase [Caldilineaceae bacterium]